MLERSHKIPAVLAATIASLAIAASVAASCAQAAGDCGLIAPSTLTKDLHLPKIYESNPLELGTPSGSVDLNCDVVVWSGTKPLTAKAEAAKLANGTLAELDINTWAPGSGLLSSAWTSGGFANELMALELEAQKRLIVARHGRSFAPPALGANASGYKGVKGATREAEALWSLAGRSKIMQLAVLETKEKPAVTQLEKVAAVAVPGFGL
jgi:hypothetical protein